MKASDNFENIDRKVVVIVVNNLADTCSLPPSVFSCNFLALRLVLAPGPMQGDGKLRLSLTTTLPRVCAAAYMRALHVRHSQILRRFPHNWSARPSKLLACILEGTRFERRTQPTPFLSANKSC